MSQRWRFGLVSLAALTGLVLTLMLGRWQLGRAAEKQQLQARIEAQAALSVLDNAALFGLQDPAQQGLHRSVQLQGRWLAGQTVYLDNRQMNAKPGLLVLTPLMLQGPGSRAILVQRGWVARNFLDRSLIPTLVTPDGVVVVQGRMAPPPSKLYQMGPTDSGLIRQNLDLAAYRAETGLDLMAVSVLQTLGAGDGLLRDWPVANLGVDKHYGYAFQWFGLSGLIAVLYVWFQIVRKVKPTRRP